MNDNELDIYLKELEKYSDKYNEISKTLKRLGVYENIPNKKENIFKKIDIDIFIMVSAFLIMALLGLFVVNKPEVDVEMYYGGLIFFVAGVLIGLFVQYFGIIFLFSHGLTGLGIMVNSLCKDVFNSSLMSDNPRNLYIYLGIVFLILLSGFVTTILYNVSRKFKEIQHFKTLPILLFLVGLIGLVIFPYISNFIYHL